MTQSVGIHALAPEDPGETFDRVGSDEEGHEFLIDLYFDNEEQANGMADRFPSLDDIAAGKLLHQSSPLHCCDHGLPEREGKSAQ